MLQPSEQPSASTQALAKRSGDQAPPPEVIQGMFAKVADHYDLVNEVTSLGIDRSWRRKAVQLASVTREGKVLDLAAGTGDLTLEMARQAQPAMVVSSDFVSRMLELGKKKAANYKGPTQITFQVADAMKLPYKDNSFDAVTIGFGVRNIADRQAHFKEAWRVLKPGGRYVMLEFGKPALPPFRVLYNFYLRHVVPLWGGVLGRDRAAYQYLNESIRGFPGQRAIGEELSHAGFTHFEWHTLTLGICTVFVCQK